jgi:mono/diheme cytochrome c family protein
MIRLGLLTAVLAVVGSANAQAAPSVARGEYLVTSIGACGSCHTPFGPGGFDESKALSGRPVEDVEAFTAIAPNITPAGRVKDWSDAELAKAIREGIRPDGSLIGPPMPFEVYKGIADDDLASMVMYLRTVPAVENDPGTSVYRMPLPPAYGPPITSVASVPEGVTAEYGEYLAGPMGHCIVCHTPMENGQPLFESMLGAGGNEFAGPWGVSVSANITPAGLADYSDAEIARMITHGERPDGSPMLPPMAYAYYERMNPDDVSAIVAYLRTLEPKQ